MTHVVIVGAQWGDEGKAKITDMLAESADVVIRCQGGCNAGHTVSHQGNVFKFHLIPSGMLYPNKLCIIGPGTVINPHVLLQEIDTMQARGYSTANLRLSDRAHLTLPFHALLDKARENALAGKKIGTTGRGIGPTYMDKVGRNGIRIGDLFAPQSFLTERLTHTLEQNKSQLSALAVDIPTISDLQAFCKEIAEQLKPYVCDTVALVHQAIKRDESLLFEGAQGTLLDVDYGTYPFVTSSNATAGGACTGSGVGPSQIDQVIGVMKAYTTRVGEGPFPTELHDHIGKHLLEVGQEFGTTTGRPRRCGWFDSVLARYSTQVNGLTGLAITKIDVMDDLDEIKLCVAYEHRKTKERFHQFPSHITTLAELDPVYETFPGWKRPLQNIRRYEDLPTETQQYLQRLSELTEAPVQILSVGPERDQTIILEEPFQKTASLKKKELIHGAQEPSLIS